MYEPFHIRQGRAIQAHIAAIRKNGPFITDERGENPRTAFQFFKSVQDYLEWRSGRIWRPISHRFHFEVDCYTAAKREFHAAFYSTEEKTNEVEFKKPMSRAAVAGADYSFRNCA